MKQRITVNEVVASRQWRTLLLSLGSVPPLEPASPPSRAAVRRRLTGICLRRGYTPPEEDLYRRRMT